MKVSKIPALLFLTFCLVLSLSSIAGATSYSFTSSDNTGTTADMMDLEHGSYYGWSITGSKANDLASQLEDGYYIKSATLTYKNIYNWVKETNDQLNTFLLSSPPPMPGSGNYTVGLYNSDGTEKGKTYFTYKDTLTNLSRSTRDSKVRSGYDCTGPVSNRYTCTKQITTTTKQTSSRYTYISEIFKQDKATVDGTGKKLSDNLWSRADQQSLDTINWGNGVEVTRIWDKENDFANPWHDIDGPASKTNVVYNFDDLLIGILTTYAGDGSFGFGMDPDCHYYNDGITFSIETERTPVPEPGTMMLLGFGMLGLAVYGKRRMNKEV